MRFQRPAQTGEKRSRLKPPQTTSNHLWLHQQQKQRLPTDKQVQRSMFSRVYTCSEHVACE